MIRSLLGLSLLVATAPALAALKPGAAAPDFATQGALAGKAFNFSLKQALKKGPVVLYFYPKAFTSGCTIEAHEFAEATPEFNKMGATVIGVSGDDLDTLKRFSTEECRDKFAVAIATPAIIKSYDVALPVVSSRSNRTSYVIAPNGKIVFAYSAMSPQGHVTGTLDAVRKWKARK
jgi:thioredoxin-dependent peroxiredoxin